MIRLLWLSLALLVGCGSARRSETVQGTAPLLTRPEQRRGELVFMKNCNQCHPLGEGGLGPALNNKPLPAAAIKAKVRTLPGDMPKFSDTDITARELDDLVSYVQALRKND